MRAVWALWFASGCDVVFDLHRPPADVAIDVTENDAAASCESTLPAWTGPIEIAPGAFSLTQHLTHLSPLLTATSSRLIYTYRNESPAEGPALTWAELTAAGWVHRGYVTLASLTPATSSSPTVFRQGGQPRLFFVADGAAYLGDPTSATSLTLASIPLTLPPEASGGVLAGATNDGTRVIVAMPDQSVLELGRDPESNVLFNPRTILQNARNPAISDDGCRIYFDQDVSSNVDLFVAIRESGGTFGTPRSLLGTTPELESFPSVSGSGTLFYSSRVDVSAPYRMFFRTAQ